MLSRAIVRRFLPLLVCLPAAAQDTQRVSVDSNGSQSNGFSERPSMSADGGWIVFQSTATDLVIGDTNGVTDVFARNQFVGSTFRISVSSSGVESNAGSAN